MERKTLSHKGNIGTTADGDHRREIRPARVVARQHVVERVDEAGQWILDQVFELFPSHLDARAAPGKLSEQFRGNVGGQSFLCRTALLPELAELPDRGGTGRIDVIAVPELVDDPKQQSLVDLTTGKVLVPCRGTNGLEIRRPGIRLGLHQGDVSRGATEIKQPHHTAVGRAQFEFTAVNAAIASETRRGAMPLRTKPTCVRKPLRSACTAPGFQCAGTAMAISEELASAPAVSTIASSASTSKRSGSCTDPSGDTSATASPMRSTKPLIRAPGSIKFGFWLGTPIFGAQCGYRVSTARRVTGGPPLPAATRFVVPIDNPSGSYIAEGFRQ